MKQKPQSTDHRKLMDRLTPGPGLGRLLGLLATSYEMQPEFLETDFLPTLLGLGAWDDRNWTSRIALEKHLAELEAATLLIDARPYRGRPRSLRVEVEPVFFPSGRILHAKILLAVYEDAIRFTFGSANLTEPGYRRNREVAAALTASPSHPVEARIILSAVRDMRPLLNDWMTFSAQQLCTLAEERLAEWAGDEGSSEQWFVWGGGPQPIWQQVVNHWPEQDQIERITIASPFWSEEDQDGPVSRFLKTLLTRGLLAPGAQLRLLTEAAPAKQGTYKPKLPESFATFDAGQIGVTATALAVDPRIPPEEIGMGEEFTGTRALHAKIVLLEGAQTALACLGSANFTHRGWGFLPDGGQANVEAGLLLRRSGKQRRALQQLLPPTTGGPVSLDGAASGRLAVPEPSPEELAWPGFLREVLLAPTPNDPHRLGLVIVVEPQAIDGSWQLEHLPADGEPPEPALFSMQNPDSNLTSPDGQTISLSTAQLERLLREQEVLVKWWLCAEGRTFPVNVEAAAKTALPISPGTGRPAEQHLIAYYQGRITWEELFPDPEGESQSHDNSPGEDDASGVDTSRIQSYIVREFVEALKGITDDLKAAAQSPKACMRLALLGAVSPVALARRVVESAQTGERTPTATGFQLVEILGCLEGARHFPASERFKTDWTDLIAVATQQVVEMLEMLQARFPEELSHDFHQYARTVREHYQTQERAG